MGKKVKKTFDTELMRLLSIFGVLLTLLILLFLGRNIIIKTAVEKAVEVITGLHLKMGSFNLGLYKSVVRITDLKIYNPPGYQDPVMLEVPEIFVNYNLPDIFKKKIHIQQMKINLKEFVVVRNDKKELNLQHIKTIKRQEEPEAQETKSFYEFAIDQLNLKIGKVIYKDYSVRGGVSVKEFPLQLNEQYRDISNPRALVSLIVFKALAKTTIASLTNFDLNSLKSSIPEVLKSAVSTSFSNLTSETIGVIQGTTRTITDTLKIPLQVK